MLKFERVAEDTGVKAVAEWLDTFADELDCVMLIGLTKEGYEILRTSKLSRAEKFTMVGFMNAFAAQTYPLDDLEPL